MTETNRRPADRLADIREQIRLLKAEEELMRQGFIDGTLPLAGDDYTVTVAAKTIHRLDHRTMRERVAEDVWRPFMRATSSTYVTLEKKDKAK